MMATMKFVSLLTAGMERELLISTITVLNDYSVKYSGKCIPLKSSKSMKIRVFSLRYVHENWNISTVIYIIL